MQKAGAETLRDRVVDKLKAAAHGPLHQHADFQELATELRAIRGGTGGNR